jgi:hypothetical protein
VKHCVYKYSKNWYGSCGCCLEVVSSRAWRSAMDLLEIHVRTHAVDVLTGAASTAHDYRGTYPLG